MNNKNIIIGIVVLLIIVGGIYFFSSQGSNTPTPAYNTNPTPTAYVPKATPVPTAVQIIHNVSISNFAFLPANITVRKGETIVWTNKDPMTHTVTGGDMKSSALGQNQTFSFTYDKTGTFTYHCSIHPRMTGIITVTN